MGLGESAVRRATLQRESGIFQDTDGFGIIKLFSTSQGSSLYQLRYISYILFPVPAVI